MEELKELLFLMNQFTREVQADLEEGKLALAVVSFRFGIIHGQLLQTANALQRMDDEKKAHKN